MITLSNEFELRSTVLSLLMMQVLTGKMTINAFRPRFAKTFVETLNKAPNPSKFYKEMVEIPLYNGVFLNYIDQWTTDMKEADKRSKERDDVKRFESCVDHVFGAKPNDKAAKFLQELLG